MKSCNALSVEALIVELIMCILEASCSSSPAFKGGAIGEDDDNNMLATPTNVKAEVDDDAVKVTWDEVKYAESYDVLRRTDTDDEGSWEYVGNSVIATSWIDKRPYTGNNYYMVQANGHNLRSEWSEIAKVYYSPRPQGVEKTTYTARGVSFKMVKVAGGTFKMGATEEQESFAYYDEKPVHEVTLSDYYIGETEVTQELWGAVMGSNPSYHKGTNLPVDSVSWDDCQDFIKELNSLTGKNFRLPTEAEWEFAARGGNKSKGYKYSGSSMWYRDNSNGETHVVVTKLPNELGLYDMSGNVWEWCQDWYDSHYYSNSPKNNPTGPSSGYFRVMRGGSWRSYPRVSYRGWASGRINDFGLRLAL